MLATWVAQIGPTDGNGAAPTLELISSRGAVGNAEVGPYRAVFDGVLHNRSELERTLETPPGSDDAALVLAACERWGIEALQQIKGIFALAVWESGTGFGFLARDPLGIYPLFYVEAGDRTLISTSIDALLESDGVSTALNRAALADHLCHVWPRREETYFEAVKRVPPGHALVLDRGGAQLHRHWDPAPPGDEIDWVTEDELEHFHELFDQAVNRCLALGPAGIFLSGGLDSVSIAGAALDNCRAQGLPEPLALSVVFPHPECNEEDAQRAIAGQLGLDQVFVNLNDAVGDKGLLLSACDGQADRAAPMLNYYAAPYLQLSRDARKRGCTTILTGDGGDEWLTVTPLYATDLIRAGDVRGLIRHASSIRRSFNLSAPRVWHNALWRFGAKQILKETAGSTLGRFAPGVLDTYRRRVVRKGIPQWVAPDSLLRQELEHRGVEGWPEPPTDGRYRAELRLSLDHALVSMEMEEKFENTRRTGTRMLAPFFDAELVHFLYRVPPDLLDRGGRAKGLVRDEVARRFPDLGFERHKKISALSFAREVALEQGRRAWSEVGGVPALSELGVVDAASCERELQTILAGRERDAFRIWDVLNLESWTRSRL
jgi:asparagine synthase (glutamine-hydrolysing)